MSKKIRAFIGIALNSALRQELVLAMQKLKLILPQKKIRWISPENLHLTLKFLGDIEISVLDELTLLLHEKLKKSMTFNLQFNKLHYLPSAYKPHVLTALFYLNTEIAALYHQIEEGCAAFELAKEHRPFKAHITVARMKDLKKLDETALSEIKLFQPLNVTAINIYQSDLTVYPSVYKILWQVKLN